MLIHPGGSVFTDIKYPPKDWHFIEWWGDGHAFAHTNGLRLLIDCGPKEDKRQWLHVSVSRRKWVPSHEDMCLVKHDFIGSRYAYAVYPPSDVYVNIHSYCLHLWALAEGDGKVLPEFSGVIDGIGRSI
jgi:hypothetical protein